MTVIIIINPTRGLFTTQWNIRPGIKSYLDYYGLHKVLLLLLSLRKHLKVLRLILQNSIHFSHKLIIIIIINLVIIHIIIKGINRHHQTI